MILPAKCVGRALAMALAASTLAPAAMAQDATDQDRPDVSADPYPADPGSYPDQGDEQRDDQGRHDPGEDDQGAYQQPADDLGGYDRDDSDSDRDRGAWNRDDRQDRDDDALRGSGVADLYPALRYTHQGRWFVLRRFDFNRDGRIDRDEAREANRTFFRMADRDHDGRLSADETRFSFSPGFFQPRWGDRGRGNWERGSRYEDR